ncbi:hypothetical protein MKW92_006444 [Papaver armeniacum]|nr:hypothetical protein MKW92_006444 [Papaver armeniacum]
MSKLNEEIISKGVCINETLTDDELRSILSKLDNYKDKEGFGLVCKKWLHLQSTERRKLCARAGPLMLKKMAARFSRIVGIRSLSITLSFVLSWVTDSDLWIGGTWKGLPRLQSLDISYCRKLTDKGLTAIAEGCRNLRNLHLVGCRFITDGTLIALSKNCPHLEALALQGCINITDSGFHLFHVLLFTTLKLLDCLKAGDDSIYSLARSCKNLETLVIGGCRNISDESIKSLAFSCNHKLKFLRMDWCLSISDSALSCILSLCKNLEALDIGCCEEVTDRAFQDLASSGFESSLKILRISSCPKITVFGITKLLESCKTLQYLDVRSCPQITEWDCDQAGLLFPAYCKVNFTGSLSGSDFLIDVFDLMG